MAAAGSLVEADLHGLVDGQIEPERRVMALRRLAASPADRTRVEAWQAQNDLLRSAFAGVDRESLPAALALVSRPQLHCIPANDPPLIDAAQFFRGKPKRRRLGAAAAAIVVTAGLVGSWTLLGGFDANDAIVGAPQRGPVDTAPASRSAEALAEPTSKPIAPRKTVSALPTTQIPSLQSAGFSFTGAEIDASEPPSISFRYKNGSAEHVVVNVARSRASNGAGTTPTRIGNAISWHKGGKAYAMTGTVKPDRLRVIAAALQD